LAAFIAAGRHWPGMAMLYVSTETTMARSLTCAVILVPLVVFNLCGCSKSSPLPLQLAQQIATADRVLLTNHPSSSLAFSGSEAQKLVRAVSESRKIKMPKDSAPSCPAGFSLQFYKGTNLLSQVEGHDNHFHTPEGDFYQDESGALQAAWQAVYDHDRR